MPDLVQEDSVFIHGVLACENEVCSECKFQATAKALALKHRDNRDRTGQHLQ